MATASFCIDPGDPRAPSAEVWASLSADERASVVASLPSEFPSATPPEGDRHRTAKSSALESLGQFFRKRNRQVYLSSELPVYYPEERVFAPDLLAVLDVEDKERQSWIVSAEGRGLDFVLEVHVGGDRRKDFIGNVERYAGLGIPEYFAFDPMRTHLAGWRLSEPSASTYAAIVPQGGLWRSDVLDVDLALVNSRLRFFHGGASLPDAQELVERLTSMVDTSVVRAEQESQRASEEARRAEQEAQRAQDEAQRAQDEAQRAQDEAQRADSATARAEVLAEKLRELGIDPDSL